MNQSLHYEPIGVSRASEWKEGGAKSLFIKGKGPGVHTRDQQHEIKFLVEAS